jgi:hypothetical protein
MRPVVSAVLLAITATAASAQSWEALVASRWPHESILKVSEREFTDFMHRHLVNLGDKPGAVRAFQSAQARAYGAGSLGFAVPTPARRELPVGPGTDNPISEAPEPNDAPSNGGIPTLCSLNDEGQGNIDVGGDDDWWQFSLVATTSISVFTARGPGAGFLADSVIRLFDSSGLEIAFNDDYAGRGLYSQIDRTLPAGVYFVGVRAFGATATGTYVVDLAVSLPAPPVPSFAEGPEPNDTAANATPMACDARGLGEVAVGGDIDWWQFVLTAQTTVTGVTGALNPNGTAIGDTLLWLYDASGTQLAFDDDGGPGLYSQIVQTLDAGTYYFAVGGFSTRTGHYNLDVDCGGLPRPVTASYAISGTGCPDTAGLTPTLSVPSAELPVIGSTFTIDCSNLTQGRPTFGNIGFTTSIPGGLSAPLDLGVFGAPGCTLFSDIAVLYPLAVQAPGQARYSLRIPPQADLEGLTFYQQVLVLDAQANALGLYSSNALTGRFGRNL